MSAITNHAIRSLDCPCGPTVTKPCTQCHPEDDGSSCWLCDGVGRIACHEYDLEKARKSLAEKGLLPDGVQVEHDMTHPAHLPSVGGA